MTNASVSVFGLTGQERVAIIGSDALPVVQDIAELPPGIVAVTASRSLGSPDNGKVLVFSGASGITLTAPVLPVGFNCAVVQAGAGQVTFAAGSGATVNNRQSFTKTAGQYAVVGLLAIASGSFILSGDGA